MLGKTQQFCTYWEIQWRFIAFPGWFQTATVEHFHCYGDDEMTHFDQHVQLGMLNHQPSYNKLGMMLQGFVMWP